MSGSDQAVEALHAEVRVYREAHHARLLRELDAIAADLTEALLQPEVRAAGHQFAYRTEAWG
ncbi:hypothetical protein ACFW2Y_30595 [Streptomyces sp. NPDC058877]|uniref:hypothetical protein n=1 Tax=Streptomyces sp. NPDC058877 TaxID=3346665 RepID=UPI00367DA4FF